ncbi:MAG: Fe-S cluster assembly ATPase SufC [Alphaproteobacteria bacterium]|nr:Fe-S cluster assembly ATPase SufC [Alphaproteobacteria bacterium]
MTSPRQTAGHIPVAQGEALLEIEDLHATVAGEEILKGLSLSLNAGEVHAIMGPNGSGKSTLSYVLAGREGYTVTSGALRFKGEDLTSLSIEERAARGIFLAMQYPVEIPGVTTLTFLKTALNAQRRARGQSDLDAVNVLKRVRSKAAELQVSEEMLRRPINVGFSGGEKKRLEILQMSVFEPTLAILDETDSGLDIDALKLVANGVNALRDAGRAMLVITHYQRLLDYIVPDRVHVLAKGRIVAEGGKELAIKLEATGYAQVAGERA